MTGPIMAALLLVAAANQPQSEGDLGAIMERYLEAAPMQVAYSYAIGNSDFSDTTQGVLYLSAPSVFRLSFFDKVYGSDGASVYLHDTNTHQTVIDSLRWNEMQLWLRLLSGQLPEGTQLVGSRHAGRLSHFDLLGPDGKWEAELTVNEQSGAIARIAVVDRAGLSVVIDLETPRKWTPSVEYIRLSDLPGERLDLR
ncbi:MAG: hypothetical protein IIA59_10090 [Candidatus Marinimicrobia bacterium]|nr:hypothetical protein [Candidatus Neomarinimicrobiota bacterium]